MGVLLDGLRPKHLLICGVLFILIVYFTVLGFSPATSVQNSGPTRTPEEAEKIHSIVVSLERRTKPHIVFILADDLGYNDVGYHHSDIKTPNLDRLAREGIRLENYYVQPVCSPSRSQLMTGKYQIHTGLQHSYIRLTQPNCMPTDLPTLPEKLREAGYATHMVGKWHLGFYRKECLPLDRGFDSFYGILSGKADHEGHNNSEEIQGKGRFIEGYDFWDGNKVDLSAEGYYDMGLYNHRAARIIAKHDKSKPLFLYFAHQAIHTPLQAPEEYIERYRHINDEDRRLVAAMTTSLDDSVGQIVETLKRNLLWENTVLIFSSDNGGRVLMGSNWPLRGYKGSLWEGGIRAVGFITSELLPQSVRGTVSRQLMDISDWFPTLVKGVANHSLEGLVLDGYNMWDSLRLSSLSPRHELLHNIDPWPKSPETFNVNITAAIRSGDWKLLTGDPGAEGGVWVPVPDSGITPPVPPDLDKAIKVWLFNITADPSEKVDLSQEYKHIVDELVEKLKRYYAGSVPVSYPDWSPQSDPDLRDGVWGPWN